MNKIEFLILSILLSNGAVGKLNAMTVKDIIAAEGLKYGSSAIYKHLQSFQNKGFVNPGLKEGKAFTFYITKAGIQKLKEEKEDEK